MSGIDSNNPAADSQREPNPLLQDETGVALAQELLSAGSVDIDWDGISGKLNEANGDLRKVRRMLEAGNAALVERFLASKPVTQLVRDRARLVDTVIIDTWQRVGGKFADVITLAAVGGYGRNELHPYSDVDLLMIVPSARKARQASEEIAAFLAFLWDVGMEVGHSTRTVSECRSESEHDIGVATTLMESRIICGPQKLFDKMQAAVSPPKVWNARAFFEAKLKEQQNRHRRYNDTAYNLEPNIKGSPGGLRDIQVIVWVARRYFGTGKLDDLVEQKFLTPAQLGLLRQGREFLWRIRFALHALTGRREDRLLFDHQIRIARVFGYEDTEASLAVEQFMQRYYRTVMDLSRLNEMLLQLFQEAILMNPAATPEPINNNFEVRNGFLQITKENIFQKTPSALLELFLILQQHPELKGVSAYTIALVRRYLSLIDDDFRHDPKNHQLFLNIIQAPEGVTHELRRMNLYGVLGQYIPAFGKIVGRMQYDLFHAYTVDAHTLFVVSNLRRLALKRFDHELPYCSEIMQRLENPTIAYLGGLFHDIAKGRGGDHSELGAVDAEAFCLEHGLSRYDARLVAWLVKSHLKLSMTAQKKDISDPDVINEFAGYVGDEAHLDYLYLLTVSDVRGTNPKLWNSWKAQLFQELYESTRRALRRGLANPIDKENLLQNKQATALSQLLRNGVDESRVLQIWKSLGEEYFLRCRPEEIVWHSSLLAGQEAFDQGYLIDIQDEQDSAGTAVFMYTDQLQFTFAITTAILDELGYSIVDARIIPLKNDYSLSVYVLLDNDGQKIEPARHDQLLRRLGQAISSDEEQVPEVTRKAPRQARMFTTTTHVDFSTDETNNRTVMEITTSDRPELMSSVGKVLKDNMALIQTAKIMTIGERAEDTFYITGESGGPIDADACKAIREQITTALDHSQ